jgi:hypothetical protein
LDKGFLQSGDSRRMKQSVGGGVLRRVANSGGGVFVGGDFPGGWVGEKAADELGVEGVASLAGFDSAEKREAD